MPHPHHFIRSASQRRARLRIFGLLLAVLAALIASAAPAQTIGVSIGAYRDLFLLQVRDGIAERAEGQTGVSLVYADGRNDVTTQLNQIQTFLANGVDALIVIPVDTDATAAMTAAASAAGVPMVFVNREPANIASLPTDQGVVVSVEREAGQLQAEEACRRLKAAGKTKAKVVILIGELTNQGARLRTAAVEEVLARPDCNFMVLAAKQSGRWQRAQGAALVTGWLSAGITIDAVLSNNDEMAIGAAQALRAAGMAKGQVLVAGIDGTADALQAMEEGLLDFTVFQDGRGQGAGALDLTLDYLRGASTAQIRHLPFELVTPERIAEFRARN